VKGTRTPHTLDSRTLDAILPALAGLSEEMIKHHLQRGNQKPLQQAIRKVLESRHLGRLPWQQFEMLLRGVPLHLPPIVIPDIQLAEDEPIRKMFPNGWYVVVPEGVDLVLLHQLSGQFGTILHSREEPWFLNEGYGEWKEDGSEVAVERIPTETLEVFIPDPSDWMLPDTKGKDRARTIEMMGEFGASAPEGWTCPVPSGEEWITAVFEYHHQTGEYPTSGWNYVRFRNRDGRGYWLCGGYFVSGGFDVHGWDSHGDGNLGGARWLVRRGKVRIE